MEKAIITAILVVFGVVMIVFMIVAIVRAIFYIIYQKSDKIHYSPFTYCELDAFSFSLFYKKKKIDTFIVYYKHKGFYYILGTQNIYKLGKSKLTVLNEDNTSESEKKIINNLKADAKCKISEYNQVLQGMLVKYGDDMDNR